MVLWRTGWRTGAAAVLAAVLLGGCASTVIGTAGPLPGQGPVAPAAADPCSLLTPEQAGQVGLNPQGKPTEAHPADRVPALCSWSTADVSDPKAFGPIVLAYATDMSLITYHGETRKPVEEKQFGGLTWQRYDDPILRDKGCDWTIMLGPKSFVSVGSSNFSEPDRACEGANAVTPLVASHLPGGAPAPPPTSTTKPGPPAALPGVDACTLLSPEQAEGLKLAGTGRPIAANDGLDIPPGCEWEDTDGRDGQLSLTVYTGDKPADEWPYADKGGQPVTADGRKWTVFPRYGNLSGNCQATLAVSDTTSVRIGGGDLNDPKNGCGPIKAAIPLVTGHLPK